MQNSNLKPKYSLILFRVLTETKVLELPERYDELLMINLNLFGSGDKNEIMLTI
jgi:hypothetical protein